MTEKLWRDNQCNREGIPFCKLAGTWLQKGDEKKVFMTQDEVDQAWEDGWHAVNRPETATENENGDHAWDPYTNPVQKRYGEAKTAIIYAECVNKEIDVSSMSCVEAHAALLESAKPEE